MILIKDIKLFKFENNLLFTKKWEIKFSKIRKKK